MAEFKKVLACSPDEGSCELSEVEGNERNEKEDDEVSVIAVIEKENNRFAKYQQNPQVSRISNFYSRFDLPEFSSDSREKTKEVIKSRKKEDRRVIVLGHEPSKMALQKQVLQSAVNDRQNARGSDDKSMGDLRKFPSETIGIKQDLNYKDDSDYIRESTETSSGSSSTSGSGAEKIRRFHRAVRKSRAKSELRRNPIRVTKKDSDKDFPRPRQRLLSAKRKGTLFNSELTKRGKSSTMPYMNTRSVTRKMYNVGATYQAPTKKDETEWKEWPVHGMHERPVFHPQVGLAVEYLGKCFSSPDGFSYHEITDRSEIEIVSVDPHSDYLPWSNENMRIKRASYSQGTSNIDTPKPPCFPEKKKSFESCMHESLHCVLGYCSQVMTPTYKTRIEVQSVASGRDEKTKSIPSQGKDSKLELGGQQQALPTTFSSHSKSDSPIDSKVNSQRSTEVTQSRAMTGSQSVQSFAKTRLFPTQKMYVANSQKAITFTNLKTLQGGQLKIQEVVRPSKNPLILMNGSEAKTMRARVLKTTSNDSSLIQLEDTEISDDTLMEMSSIYTNSASPEKTASTSYGVNSARSSTANRGNKVEFTVTKYLLNKVPQNKIPATAISGSSAKPVDSQVELANKRKGNIRNLIANSSQTRCVNEAVEIAKILSEYNKSTARKSAIESQVSSPPTKSLKNVLEYCKEETASQSRLQENVEERNVNVKLPEGKWRRYHLTMEKFKDLKGNNGQRKLPSMMQIKENVTVGQSKANPEEKENSFPNISGSDAQSLQELLENTAVLYCAATGTHQDDLANYIDSLDANQSLQWLEMCRKSIL